MKRTFKPRLPEAAREKLHKGSVHKDKKKYNRRRDKQLFRQVKFIE